MRIHLPITVAMLFLAACSVSSSSVGHYKATHTDRTFLDLGPQHRVVLHERESAYRGHYSTYGDRVRVVLEKPYINGMTEQEFRKQGSLLIAVSGPRDLFLPGGTRFQKVD